MGKCCNTEAMASLGIRLTLGVFLLIAGIGKISKFADFASMTSSLMPYAPYLGQIVAALVMIAEIALGIMLIFGIMP